MKLQLPIILLFFSITFTICSQNLVLNPSFEDFHDCPKGLSFFHNNVKNWTIPNNGTTDYFNSCSTTMGYKNFAGQQKAKTGNGYAGIYTYYKKDYREYIQGELSERLKRGNKYKVSFYISLADNSRYAIKELGVLFLADRYNYFRSKKNILAKELSKKHPHINLFPTFSKDFYSDDEDWKEVSFTYTAQGFETYFIIGNFNNNGATEKGKPRKSEYESFSYYYIDDVSIEAVEKKELIEKEKPKEETLKNFEIKHNEVNTFKNILFDFDNAELLENSFEELKEIYEYLSEKSEVKIEIYGHTDNTGIEKRNRELSYQRAKAVADYLILQGLEASKIEVFGYGSSKPISENKTEEGRAQNRRVEFKLIE